MVESCLFVYPTTYNRILKEIHFFVFFGRDPKLPQELLVNHENLRFRAITTGINNAKLFETLRSAHNQLGAQKQTVILKYKDYYDKTHKAVTYTVGDRVLVHYTVSEKEGLKFKLGNRWRGPFTIDAQIDAVTYRFKKANGSTNNRKVNCSLKVLKFY